MQINLLFRNIIHDKVDGAEEQNIEACFEGRLQENGSHPHFNNAFTQHKLAVRSRFC